MILDLANFEIAPNRGLKYGCTIKVTTAVQYELFGIKMVHYILKSQKKFIHVSAGNGAILGEAESIEAPDTWRPESVQRMAPRMCCPFSTGKIIAMSDLSPTFAVKRKSIS